MKNREKHTCTLYLFYLLTAVTSAQSYQWSESTGGSLADVAYSVAADAMGNVYTTGVFSGTVDFDPGAGVTNLTAAGMTDIFVLKLDASGNFVWARKIGGTMADGGNSIVLDAIGDIYISGQYFGTVDFNPGPGTFNLISAGNYDIFIAKLDTAGNLIWAKSMGGTQADVAYRTVLDNSGNIYTTGSFQDTADFDPGSGVFDLLTNGNKDIFIQKLDASGDFVWAKNLGGTSTDEGSSIALNSSGEVYTTGYFEGTADFDPDPANVHNATSAGGRDIFVSRLDAAGNFISAKTIGGTGADEGNFLLIDSSDKLYLTGSYEGTVDFNPGPGTINLVSLGGKDAFFLKFNPANNRFRAGSMGGSLNDEGNALAVDSTNNNILICGSFNGTADFNPGAGVYNLTSTGFDDIFLAKLGPAGAFKTARAIGGNGNDSAETFFSDSTGNFYIAGRFNTTVDFNPSTGVANHTSMGDFDLFVLKL